MKTKQIQVALAAIFCAASFSSMAQTATTTVGVTTTVIANCTVTSTPIAFGSYDSLSATPTTATGSVALTCSQGTAPSVALGDGANASGVQRRMTDGTSFLPYSIFRPVALTPAASCAGAVTDYPNTTPGLALPAAPNTTARSFNLCGSIAAGVSVPVGSYTDTVLATITF